MAQKVDSPHAPAPAAEAEGRLRFEGTLELGGTVTGPMLGILFGPESKVDGNLRFDGPVQIDGTYRGAIHTNDLLVVGEHAKIQADITCRSAEVKGDIVGNITASESVDLQGYAVVKGDITAPALAVEKGVMFDGTSRMETPAATPRRPSRS